MTAPTELSDPPAIYSELPHSSSLWFQAKISQHLWDISKKNPPQPFSGPVFLGHLCDGNTCLQLLEAQIKKKLESGESWVARFVSCKQTKEASFHQVISGVFSGVQPWAITAITKAPQLAVAARWGCMGFCSSFSRILRAEGDPVTTHSPIMTLQRSQELAKNSHSCLPPGMISRVWPCMYMRVVAHNPVTACCIIYNSESRLISLQPVCLAMLCLDEKPDPRHPSRARERKQSRSGRAVHPSGWSDPSRARVLRYAAWRWRSSAVLSESGCLFKELEVQLQPQ